MSKLNNLQHLLNDLVHEREFIKSELIIHQKTSKIAAFHISKLSQNLNKNKKCIKTIMEQIEIAKKYNTI